MDSLPDFTSADEALALFVDAGDLDRVMLIRTRASLPK